MCCTRTVDDIREALIALHAKALDNAERFAEGVTLDTSVAAAEAHLGASAVHDPDYVVFRRFAAGQLIIDVGANSGYSATSIWAAGSDATVLSVEALPVHRPALSAIKARRPQRFDFQIVAASDREMALEFLIPVIDGLGLSSLATAVTDVHWPSLSENLLRFGPRAAEKGQCTVGLTFVRSHAKRLDLILASDFRIDPRAPIAAVKIDVEGLEPEVIAGARRTLQRHRPLLLIEGARWRPSLVETLRSMGYRTAARHEDQLTLSNGPGEGVNSFFVHSARLMEYWRSGLLNPIGLAGRSRLIVSCLLPTRASA
jgi:FkbM family methyltransferase